MAKILFLIVSMLFVLQILVGNIDAASTESRMVARKDDPSSKLIDYYSCNKKSNGNYPHPVDKTKFITCEADCVYERKCPVKCRHNQVNCPNEPTYYDFQTDTCVSCIEKDCIIPTTTLKPDQPNFCNCEDNCEVTGYCHHYSWCEIEQTYVNSNKRHGMIHNGTCDESQNLFFNPNKNAIHGGVCDFWENLDAETKEKYDKDSKCRDPNCEWRPSGKDCSSNYWYYHPKKNGGNEKQMYCPVGQDGEKLIWDQTKKSCFHCKNVRNSFGYYCC